jgi:hypothetical protein
MVAGCETGINCLARDEYAHAKAKKEKRERRAGRSRWVYWQEHSLRRLSTDALQRLALSTQLFWIGLWSVVRAMGGAVVWLVWVVEQVRRVRLLHARERLSVS